MSWAGKFKIERNRIERLLQQEAKRNPPPPRAMHSAIIHTWRELRAAVKAARAAGAGLITRTVINPPPSDHVSHVRAEPRPLANDSPRDAPPAREIPAPDPYPHLRAMTREQLTTYGFNAMSNAERFALEDELNARVRAARNPPRVNAAELERQLKAAEPKPWWWRS